MFISGMGFFTDAYDLFVIGVVATLATSEWHITGTQTSLLGSLALLTSAFGAIAFGRIADRLGRKKIYGYEVLIRCRGHRLRILARDLVADGLPGHFELWHRWRRSP